MEENPEIWRIIKLVEGGDLETSLDLVNQLLSADNTNYDALFIRGNINIFRGHYAAAVKDFTLADQIRPNNPAVLCLRGDAKKMCQQYEEALEDLNRALALAPNDPKALQQRASVFGMTGKFALALQDLNKSININPMEALVIRDRGMTKYFLGDLEGAILDLDRADRMDPLNSLTLHVRGECKRLAGDFKGALDDLTTSNQLEPNDATTLKYLGMTKYHLHDYSGAIRDLKQSIRIKPKDRECKEWLKKIELQTGSVPQADVIQPLVDKFSGLEIDYSKITFTKKIGEGGYGEVYLADWLNIKVAVKKLKSSVSFSDMSQEAKTLAVLRYKHIMTLMGITTDPATNSIILVMEYMKYGSLEDMVIKQKVQLTRTTIVQLALDIAKGLNYLHLQNPKVIHRDLKSANVLLYDGKKCLRAKISDFGTAKYLRESEAPPITVIGAFGIALPPEMVAEVEYDERVDIFSFGVVLFEMITNSRLPVLEENYRMQRIKKSITDLQLLQIVLQCCASDPQNRPTIRQCIEDLKRIKADQN